MPKKALSAEKKVRILDQEHYNFLLNPRILERWAGFTMKQRTIISSPIHRQTHSSDVFAETVSKEWGKKQKGEARKGDA